MLLWKVTKRHDQAFGSHISNVSKSYHQSKHIRWTAGFQELVDYLDVHNITGIWGDQPRPTRCPDDTPEAADSSTILMEHECCDVGE